MFTPSASGRLTRPFTDTRHPGSRPGSTERTPTARLSPIITSEPLLRPEEGAGCVCVCVAGGACVSVGAGPRGALVEDAGGPAGGGVDVVGAGRDRDRRRVARAGLAARSTRSVRRTGVTSSAAGVEAVITSSRRLDGSRSCIRRGPPPAPAGKKAGQEGPARPPGARGARGGKGGGPGGVAGEGAGGG